MAQSVAILPPVRRARLCIVNAMTVDGLAAQAAMGFTYFSRIFPDPEPQWIYYFL